jgi:hypothetical protein
MESEEEQVEALILVYEGLVPSEVLVHAQNALSRLRSEKFTQQ